MEPTKILEIAKSLLPESPSASYREFSHIEFTEEENAEILRLAREKKHFEIENRKHWEKVHAPITYPVFTAEHLKQIMLKKAIDLEPNFSLDEENTAIFNSLCLYFSADKRFETQQDNGDKWNLNKGILLFGNIGCGKTLLMKLFGDNQIASFKTYSAPIIAEQFTKNGSEGIEIFKGEIKPFVSINNPFGHKKFGLCIDDLGTEINKKHFGNELNVIADIMQARYSNLHSLINKTHITTNLTAEEITEMYGNRVSSRMREMFNMISFPQSAKDRRV